MKIINIYAKAIDIESISDIDFAINILEKYVLDFFAAPTQSYKQKTEILERMQIITPIKKLIKVAIAKGHVKILPKILEKIKEKTLKKHNKSVLKIESAQTLTAEEIDNIVQNLRQRFSKDFIVKSYVNEKLIAGIIINFDDFLIDASYLSSINLLKTRVSI